MLSSRTRTLAYACIIQSRNLAVLALLIALLEREQYSTSDSSANTDEYTFEESDFKKEETSEESESEDCISGKPDLTIQGRLDSVSKVLEQPKTLHSEGTTKMAEVDQWLSATFDAPQSPATTFNGALQKYAFESPTAKVSQVQTAHASTNRPEQALAPRFPKSKATEIVALQTTKRLTRSSSSRSPLVATPKVGTVKQEITKTVSVSPSPSAKKRKRPSSSYAPPSKYAHLGNNLVDCLASNLICVFIGVNPGLRTATAGHAYAHPSNLFWKLLHSSGCTPRRCAPEEDRDLPRLYALGNTNIVTRATKDASELSKAEMDAGVAVLEEKVARHRPESVCIVGKSIWESIWRVRHGKNIKKDEFKYGWQDERMGVVTEGEDVWEGARIFVGTTTSGLAATMRPAEKEAVWRVLGEFVERRRAERAAEAVVEA